MTPAPPMRALALAFLLMALSACAGTPPPDAPPASILQYEEQSDDVLAAPPRPSTNDPFQRFNRGVYYFNADFDRKIYLPLVNAYRFVTPRFVRTGINNFFSNLSEFRNAYNGILQARPEVAGRAAIRFVVNSTVGLLGFFDVATKAGVSQHNEDFGQTLGRWGVGSGPFLVLPIFGPSSVRDTTGLGADFVMGTTIPPASTVNDVVYQNPLIYVPFALSERDKVGFRYFDSGSPFEYDLVRFLYLKKREIDVAE